MSLTGKTSAEARVRWKALVRRGVTGRERAEAEKQIRGHVCLERWWRKTGNLITEEKCGVGWGMGKEARQNRSVMMAEL